MFPTSSRILHVDDSSTARQLMAQALKALGFTRLDSAGDGQAGARLIVAADQADDPYDLAIFDWKMPAMDGLQLLKFVRISSNNPDLLVLMSTAEGNMDSVLAAVKAGANGYVLKPIHPDALEAKLKALWDRRHAAAA